MNLGVIVSSMRLIDFIFSLIGLILLAPLFIILTIIIYFDNKSPFFIQERVGFNKKPFLLIKFRTMAVNTQSRASHLVSQASITRLGRILRKLKLDELPQLYNVLVGEMSLVGPRPNLFNQRELINLRDRYEVYKVKPGITGLAQISNVDMSTPLELAKLDSEMISSLNLKNYVYYIYCTLLGKGRGDAVKSNQ